jgi:hypothetical protein
MEALVLPDEEKTTENVPVRAAPVGSPARVRVVFASLVVLALVVSLLLWGLLH